MPAGVGAIAQRRNIQEPSMPPKRKRRLKCPVQGKTCYRDEIAATLVILQRQNTAHRREFTESRAYECRCGWWHTTSDKKEEDA